MQHHRWLALAATALLVAACGSGAATQAPAQTASQQTTAQTTGQTTAESSEAETSAETTQGGHSGNASACDLLTPAEVEQATGYSGVVAEPTQGQTDALSVCGFVSGGVVPAAIVAILDPATQSADAQALMLLPQSVDIPVSGARAVFAPASGNVLFVLKGGSIATVLITPQTGEVIDAAKAVAQKVADRL